MMIPYIRNNDYEAVQIEDEWIILNTDQYTATKLNEVGGLCWSLLSEAQTVSSLIEFIQKEYDLPNEPVEKEIEAFFAELIQYGLIEYAG